jgi:hypothetical protein
MEVDQENLKQEKSNFDEIVRKNVLRKVDLRLLPILWVVQVLAILDRVNIGNARYERD